MFDDYIADAFTVFALTYDMKGKNTVDIFNDFVSLTKIAVPDTQVLQTLNCIEEAKNKIELSSYILLAELGGMIPKVTDLLKVRK